MADSFITPNSKQESTNQLQTSCTSKFCKDVKHGNLIVNAIRKCSEDESASYMVWLCANFAKVYANSGINALQTCAVTGKERLLLWLLKNGANINSSDKVYGFTALHYSIVHRHIHIAKLLIENGASLTSCDNLRRTPIDLFHQFSHPVYPDQCSLTIHVESDVISAWGANKNYSTGTKAQNRKKPEQLVFPCPKNTRFQMISVNVYHTVFLSNLGHVFTCGNGNFGRLGHNSEENNLIPKKVEFFENRCVSVSAGLHHTLFVISDDTVWSCGMNQHMQLGILPPPVKSLNPCLVSTLSNQKISNVYAGTFHSLFWSDNIIYGCGINAGQFGQLHRIGPIISEPYKFFNSHTPVKVGCSDAAVVVAGSSGVLICHKYKWTKMSLPVEDTCDIQVYGGTLDANVISKYSPTKISSEEVKVLFHMRNGHEFYIWTEHLTLPMRVKTDYSQVLNQYDIKTVNVLLTQFSIYFAADNGFMYQSAFPIIHEHEKQVVRKVTEVKSFEAQHEDSIILKTYRIPFLYYVVKVCGDAKGENIFVIQRFPVHHIKEIKPAVECNLKAYFEELFQSHTVRDNLHDVAFQIGNKVFFGHKVIISKESVILENLMIDAVDRISYPIIIEDTNPEIFSLVLRFIYTHTCEFFNLGKLRHPVGGFEETTEHTDWGNNTGNPLNLLLMAAKRFGVVSLVKELKKVKLLKGFILSKSAEEVKIPPIEIKRSSKFADVTIVSEDEIEFHSHRCILMISDYFKSMFAGFWVESSSDQKIKLPVPSFALRIILDYLYTLCVPESLRKSTKLEEICTVLAIADQYQMLELKKMCVNILCQGFLSASHVLELFTFAEQTNSDTLIMPVAHYICLNLWYFLENKLLNALEDESLRKLYSYYKLMGSPQFHISVTEEGVFSLEGTPLSDIQEIHQLYPVDISADRMNDTMVSPGKRYQGQGARPKTNFQVVKKKHHKHSSSKKGEDLPTVDDVDMESVSPSSTAFTTKSKFKPEDTIISTKDCDTVTESTNLCERLSFDIENFPSLDNENSTNQDKKTEGKSFKKWTGRKKRSRVVSASSDDAKTDTITSFSEAVLATPSTSYDTAKFISWGTVQGTIGAGTASSSSSSSPWKIVDKPTPCEIPSADLKEIVLEQTKEAEELPLSCQPLSLIQIEEQAISELKAYHESKQSRHWNQIEVERKPHHTPRPPSWCNHK